MTKRGDWQDACSADRLSYELNTALDSAMGWDDVSPLLRLPVSSMESLYDSLRRCVRDCCVVHSHLSGWTDNLIDSINEQNELEEQNEIEREEREARVSAGGCCGGCQVCAGL